MAVKELAIEFHYLKKAVGLTNRTALKRYLTKVARKEGRSVEHINYIFCSDDYLLQVNREHLNHDYYTDIITFELSGAGQPILADIYISIDRVRDNSKAFNSTIKNELLRVIFHGLLHLVGYNDKTKKETEVMRAKEGELITKYCCST